MRAFGLIALVAMCAGCFGEDERAEILLPLGLRPIPVDQTLPGELAEGDAVAFGLRLPRKMHITQQYPDVVHAEGRYLALEDVSNYVRDRVDYEKVETGPTRTMFPRAEIDDDNNAIIEISTRRRGFDDIIEMTVRKIVPRPPDPPLETEAQRWERVGLTPDGKVIEKYAQ